jgi:hypothetical protein
MPLSYMVLLQHSRCSLLLQQPGLEAQRHRCDALKDCARLDHRDS